MQFLSRREAFLQNPILAHYVRGLQSSLFDFEGALYHEGEVVCLDDGAEGPTVLTAALAARLNDEQAAMARQFRDDFDGVPIVAPAFEGTLIAAVEAVDFADFAGRVGGALNELVKLMGWGPLTFLPLTRSAYLAGDHDHTTLKGAEDALKALGVEPAYFEAVQPSNEGLPSFLEALFWIVRCNAAAPQFCFVGEGASLIGVACHYGNIHFECFEAGEKQAFIEVLPRAGFLLSQENVCGEQFSGDEKIEGRFLPL